MGRVGPCVFLHDPGPIAQACSASLGRLPLKLLFQRQHLVFEAQLQFLQPHFFQFFIVGEVALLGEGFQPLGVLRVLLNQSLELVMDWSGVALLESASLLDLLLFITARLQSSTGIGERSMRFHREISTVAHEGHGCAKVAHRKWCKRHCDFAASVSDQAEARTESHLPPDL